jgi:hypothetical protein
MESSTTVVVSFAQNPAVAEALQGKAIGDECELELKATIKEMSPDGVVLNVEALVPDGYEVKEETESSPAPPPSMVGAGAADQTLPTMMASMVGKK